MNDFQDPRDFVIEQATPVLPAPRYGTLPPVAEGMHRFIMASNGVFVEARSAALSLCLPVSDPVPGIPYGAAEAHLTLQAGAIPPTAWSDLAHRAAATAPDEWAGAVCLAADGGYEVVEPVVESRGRGHVRWRTESIDESRMLIDVHSHGDGQAYHSAMDDRSDRRGGIFLSGVIGRSRSSKPTLALRACVHGLLLPLPPACISAVTCHAENLEVNYGP